MKSSSAILSGVVMPIFNILLLVAGTYLYRNVFKNEFLTAAFFMGLASISGLFLSLFYTVSPALCLLFSAVITGSMHGVSLMLTSFLPRRFDRLGKSATVSGLCNAFSYGGSAISSYGVAAIASAASWGVTLMVWCVIGFLGLAACVLALKPWKAFLEKSAIENENHANEAVEVVS